MYRVKAIALRTTSQGVSAAFGVDTHAEMQSPGLDPGKSDSKYDVNASTRSEPGKDFQVRGSAADVGSVCGLRRQEYDADVFTV